MSIQRKGYWRWSAVLTVAFGVCGVACDEGGVEARSCVVDRDCAGLDLCAGVARCEQGLCAAGDAVLDPDGRCAEGRGTCAADGECLAPAEAVHGLHCPVVGTAELPMVPLGLLLPLRGPDEASVAAAEASISEPGAAPGTWTRVPGGALDLEALVAATQSGAALSEGPHELHLRAGPGAEGCSDVSSRFTFHSITPSDLSENLDALRAAHAERLVAHDDPRLFAWAVACIEYAPGLAVDSPWQQWIRALGRASGDPFDVLSLGEGGSATLALEGPIRRRAGPELVVFENAVPADFIELAFVEVSSDGLHFARFDSLSLIAGPVGSYDVTEASLTYGLAGAAPLGQGVSFDLDTLRHHPDVQLGLVDLDAIRFVRVVDVVGDGSAQDSVGGPIFDPYPTIGSAGFDLQAIGVLGP